MLFIVKVTYIPCFSAQILLLSIIKYITGRIIVISYIFVIININYESDILRTL